MFPSSVQPVSVVVIRYSGMDIVGLLLVSPDVVFEVSFFFTSAGIVQAGECRM